MKYYSKNYNPLSIELKQFFEQIKEPLYLTNRFKHLNHEIIFNEIKDKNYSFLTIYLEVMPLADSLWENSEYMIKTNETISSRLEEEVHKLWFQNNNQLNEEVDDLMNKKRAERKQKKQGELIDECVEELKQTLESEAKKRIKQEYQEVHGKKWKKEFSKITNPRTNNNYERVINLPPPLDYYAKLTTQIQTYLMIDEEQKVYFSLGHSGSSGGREQHACFGHLFAKIQTELQNIPSHILVYTEENEFKQVVSLDKLVLPFNSITSNYEISRNESKKQLERINQIKTPFLFSEEFYIEIEEKV